MIDEKFCMEFCAFQVAIVLNSLIYRKDVNSSTVVVLETEEVINMCKKNLKDDLNFDDDDQNVYLNPAALSQGLYKYKKELEKTFHIILHETRPDEGTLSFYSLSQATRK